MPRNDPRRHAPAAARNRDAILAVLRHVLPARGTVLEIASGTGEHAAHFAAALPGLVWQPSDGDDAALASIDAWAADSGAASIRPALHLDVTETPWPVAQVDAVFCANMIHIAPWQAALSLLSEAGRILTRGGPLILYGPFMRDGQHTAPSNEDFDRSLRGRNPDWGVRDLAEVAGHADAAGLRLEETVSMPANNLTVIFRRR